MIYALAAAIGLVTAIIRRVPLLEIADRRFRGLGFLLAAAGIHFALSTGALPSGVAARLAEPALPGLPPTGNLVYISSLSFALLFLFVNRRLPGFPLLLLGLALNYVVIVANGGQMPGDPAKIESAGLLTAFLKARETGAWSAFTLIDEHTALPFIADVIYLPLPFRQPTVASIGDFVIALGVILFFNPTSIRRGLFDRIERRRKLSYNREEEVARRMERYVASERRP